MFFDVVGVDVVGVVVVLSASKQLAVSPRITGARSRRCLALRVIPLSVITNAWKYPGEKSSGG